MSGNPISAHSSPLQLVASVMPYSLINQRNPLCAQRSLSEQQQRTYTTASALELWISTLLNINPQPHNVKEGCTNSEQQKDLRTALIMR